MADGSRSFNFPPPQLSRLRPGEIIVDLFAGGGGASEALKQALGVDPALAYNHDEWAIGMHAVRMVGNSVSPPPLRALAEANLDPVIQISEAA